MNKFSVKEDFVQYDLREKNEGSPMEIISANLESCKLYFRLRPIFNVQIGKIEIAQF